MLQDIPNLGSSDPKISKAAALNIIKHVSQNKGDLEYLVKRLVNGLESVRIPTRSGCYSTLAALLGMRIVDPFHLFDLMQKALITNKQSTKKERRLIYIARILCTGVIYRTFPVADLSKDQEFLKASLTDIVDLSNKKSNYFQLATPFLSHLLQDASLTQENFDTNVWPSLTPFFESKGKKRKEEDADEVEEEEEEEETGTSDIVCCKVLLALLCKNGGYKEEFECLKDATKIAKSLLTCRIEFTSLFLSCLSKHLAGTDSAEDFWTAIVDNIKPTQFDLLCLCVEKAVEAKIPVSTIVSKKLVTHLLSVFKQKDVEFHVKARKTIGLLLNWGKTKEECVMGKKQRKAVLRVLFGEDSPNLLDEYKHVHMAIRPFLNRLKPRDLGTLHGIITSHLETPGLGIRMTITYLQFLGKIAQARNVNHEICFEIGKRLLNIALGQEKLVVKMKVEKEKQEEGEEEEESDDEVTEEDAQEQVGQVTLECVKTILSNTYNFEFMNLLSEYVVENYKELTSDPDTLKIIKKIKKTQKKFENQHFKYVLWAYGIRVMLDEKQVLKTSNETVSALIEVSKGIENEEELASELIKFILTTVLREPHPAFDYEEMFNKMIIEGQVKEDVIQAFADAIDVQVEEGEEEEEDSDDESLADEEVEKLEKQLNGIGDASGSEEEEEDDDEEEEAAPPKKKAKQVEAKASKDEHGSDSEESVDMDEATEEELKSMNTALARVFAVKKSMKDEGHGEVRAMMRTLKLVEIYIQRNSKSMHVSALLILLMPIIHSLQNSLKMRKNNGITTKVIGVLDNINRTKKFVGSDDAVEGTLASIADDLYTMANEKKNKLIRELLEHSVILVTKCFLQKSILTKKENKRFIELYVDAADAAKSKLRKRKIFKRKGKVQVLQTSRFVRAALDTLPDWPAGKQAIEKKIKEGQ